MDGSRAIEADHLLAGLAVWEYAEESARRIFGDATGDPIADRILEALRRSPAGLSRAHINSDVLHRNVPAARIGQAFALLWGQRLATYEFVAGKDGGRAAEVWRAA